MAEVDTVKNALSRCIGTGNCGNCKYYTNYNSPECVINLMRDSFSVINDQQEEIKRLRTQLDEAMLWR